MFTTQKYDTTATLLLQKIFPPSIPKKKNSPPPKCSELGQAAGMSHCLDSTLMTFCSPPLPLHTSRGYYRE